MGRNCETLNPVVEILILREALINKLKREKEVDQKFAINTYYPGTNAPTIKKSEDVPLKVTRLRAHICSTYRYWQKK